VSSDGGDSWQRGLAIDVSAAPNKTVVNLLGEGRIYGNIDIREGDEIVVADGETSFDGIINPEFLTDDDDSPAAALSPFGEGSLTILDGGTLFLRDAKFAPGMMYDGPSYAFVDSFTLEEGGTIAFELSPEEAGEQPAGSYSQIVTDTASLEGTLEARLSSENGLFDDMTFEDVIDANTLSGGFDEDHCILGGALGNSL
jgi:hypothetical protein